MSDIQHKQLIVCADGTGFENGKSVPLFSPGLPLEHQLLDTLRGLDLEAEQAAALRAIQRMLDDAEFRGLSNGIAYIFRQLEDETDVKLFHWMLTGKTISLRKLAGQMGAGVMHLSRRARKLEAKLRDILQGNVTRSQSEIAP